MDGLGLALLQARGARRPPKTGCEWTPDRFQQSAANRQGHPMGAALPDGGHQSHLDRSRFLGARPRSSQRRPRWLREFRLLSSWRRQIGLDLPDRASVEPTGDQSCSPVFDGLSRRNFLENRLLSSLSREFFLGTPLSVLADRRNMRWRPSGRDGLCALVPRVRSRPGGS